MSRKSSRTSNELTIEEMTITVALMNRAIVNNQAQTIFEQIARRDDRAHEWLKFHLDMPLGCDASESRGSMSDAAKRRQEVQDVEEDEYSPGTSIWSVLVGNEPAGEPYNHGTAATNVPKSGALKLSMVIPRSKIQEDMSIPMPSDCNGLDDWSMTVMKMKKYADKNWRYSKMVELAEHDKEVRSYMSWIVKTYGKDMDCPNENQATDFARFLLRMRWPDRVGSSTGFQRER